MRPKEDYTRLVVTSFSLTLAIFVAFQVYLLREPGRIATVEAHDKVIAVAAGQSLFQKNCALCHGDQGKGNSAPALNDKTFLNTADDDTLFNVVSAGVPSTEMPAWNSAHGGPLTDEDVKQVVPSCALGNPPRLTSARHRPMATPIADAPYTPMCALSVMVIRGKALTKQWR